MPNNDSKRVFNFLSTFFKWKLLCEKMFKVLLGMYDTNKNIYHNKSLKMAYMLINKNIQ